MKAYEVTLDPMVLDRFEAVCALPVPLPEDQRYSHSIKDIRPGGCIAIDVVSYKVLERYWYTEGHYSWHEIKIYNLDDGSIDYLEWEEGDELEVLIERDRLSSLKDVNLSPRKLARMDGDKSGETSFSGTQYSYHKSGNATFFRKEGDPGQNFEYWNLISRSGQMLRIKKWNNGYSVSLSDPVNPLSIQVLHPGGAGAGLVGPAPPKLLPGDK